MGIWNWVQRRSRGVEDPTRDAAQHMDPRSFVYFTIDDAPFQKWVVFVAAVGFLTDAIDIFALNVISQILPYIYGDGSGNLAIQLQAGLLISTLAGTMVGQIAFGILGDLYGRRKMYGFELIVLIIGSLGTAMASEGAGSMNVWGWIIAWRFIMGIGIGADYPLSAVIASEFAPRKHRARMLGSVFWMQPVGQVIVLVIALIAVNVSQPFLSICDRDRTVTCISNLDSIWRWVVGLGAVPAALAISFRLTIPQSPRFLMDNKKQVAVAARKTAAYYGTSVVPISIQMAQTTPLKPSANEQVHEVEEGRNSFELPPAAATPERRLSNSSAVNSAPRSTSRRSSISVVSSASAPHTAVTADYSPPVEEISWWAGFKEHFFKQGNWKLLAGTAGTWFLVDIPFYGLGLSSATIVETVWRAGQRTSTDRTMYDALNNTLWHSLVIVSAGGLVGGAIFLKIVKHVSPRTIQLWGFLMLSLLLLISGVAFPYMSKSGGNGPIILYILIQLFFNLGPNTTTYMIPAELFPTQYRCTCNGLSAAAGRFGGICAQLFVTFARFGGNTLADDLKARPVSTNTEEAYTRGATVLGYTLIVFCAFSVLGAGLTWLLTPDTRDKYGEPRSLETLAKGYGYLKQLKGETAPEDRDRSRNY